MILKLESSNNAESLMTLPLGEQVDIGDDSLPHRSQIPYKNLSKKFELSSSKDTNHQYWKMYAKRLSVMRPRITDAIKVKWSDVPIIGLHKLKDAKECIIIGTLFKRQELKPSILKDISEENKLMPQPVLEKFTSEKDDIILEDEMQRIQLVGNINVSELVTGIVCGVKGEEKIDGKFDVSEIVFAQPKETSPMYTVDSEKYMVVVSGIDLNGSVESSLPLELLVDYIMGHIGQPSEQAAVCDIVRVIIAGNSISGKKEELQLKEKGKLVKDLDNIVAQLASLCHVDIMPGEFDPTNHSMPQQPFHRCLLPEASRYTTLQNVTNPYEFELGGRTVLAFSGQNVRGVEQCSTLEDPIHIMERFCQWSHMAPTAPDTLAAHPYCDSEPFIIEQLPDIMITGNQSHFSHKRFKGATTTSLLLSVPKFSASGICALINLKTLDVEPLQFGIVSGE